MEWNGYKGQRRYSSTLHYITEEGWDVMGFIIRYLSRRHIQTHKVSLLLFSSVFFSFCMYFYSIPMNDKFKPRSLKSDCLVSPLLTVVLKKNAFVPDCQDFWRDGTVCLPA